MPSPNRVVFPNCILHITDRGNDRMPIFTCDLEYRRFQRLLLAAAQRFRAKVFAFCLMTNHFHLLAQFIAGNPGEMMQLVLLKYARWFNHRHDRVGHLFQGRYHSRVITDDLYLHEAGRYIHQNPVEAGLVKAPDQYPWSSYGAYLAQSAKPPIDLAPLSGPFKAGGAFDAAAFAAFTTARRRARGPASSPEETLNRVAGHFGLKPGDLTGSPLQDSLALPRAIAMMLLAETHHWPLTRIAARFAIGFTQSVSRSICRIRKACVADPSLAELVAGLR